MCRQGQKEKKKKGNAFSSLDAAALFRGFSSSSHPYELYPVFNLHVPIGCPGVPSEILHPERAWADQTVFEEKRQMLAKLFNENFAVYEAQASNETRAAGPVL